MQLQVSFSLHTCMHNYNYMQMSMVCYTKHTTSYSLGIHSRRLH